MADVDDASSHTTVERSVDGSHIVVSIGGEVDMANVDAVEAELDAALVGRAQHVVVDLSALTFIDSSGIAVLLRFAQKADRLELRNPSSMVQRIIQVTGLTDVLHIEP